MALVKTDQGVDRPYGIRILMQQFYSGIIKRSGIRRISDRLSLHFQLIIHLSFPAISFTGVYAPTVHETAVLRFSLSACLALKILFFIIDMGLPRSSAISL
jgi:hypothetical protein